MYLASRREPLAYFRVREGKSFSFLFFFSFGGERVLFSSRQFHPSRLVRWDAFLNPRPGEAERSLARRWRYEMIYIAHLDHGLNPVAAAAASPRGPPPRWGRPPRSQNRRRWTTDTSGNPARSQSSHFSVPQRSQSGSSIQLGLICSTFSTVLSGALSFFSSAMLEFG